MITSLPSWQPVQRHDLGFLNTLSDLLASAEKRDAGALPYLRGAKGLLVASDYGGDHKAASWQTLAFLVTDIADAAAWVPKFQRVRQSIIRDSRRIAFKNLSDRVRLRALDDFLGLSNELPGLLVTFAISKSLGSVFGRERRIDPSRLELEALRNLSAPVAERLLRIVHLFSLLVAGLSAPGQDLLWVTDEDSIVANPDRLRHLVDALGRVISHLLPHDLGHVRVATADQDPGDKSVEDLLAIPDMMAGAVSAALTSLLGAATPPRGISLPPPLSISRKTRRIMDWLSDNERPLRRLVILITEEPRARGLCATHLRLHGIPTSLEHRRA